MHRRSCHSFPASALRRAPAVIPAWADAAWRVLAAACLALLCHPGCGTASACSIPVFRFALERWDSSPYELFVFHRGKLSAPDEAQLTALKTAAAVPERKANLLVRSVDLDANPSPDLLALWNRQKRDTWPAIVLRAPAGSTPEADVWSGPLTREAIARLLDSPVRRRLADRLLKGDTGVWLFLESGDRAQDDAAAQLLQARLERLEKTLQLPAIEAEDVEKYRISGTGELKIAFSVLRVSRTDPAEEVLVRLLLRSEDDLEEESGPMAFPVFGRGRLLFGLVGKGINAETIGEACSFLVGPCSCIVKELNPGRDLLMAANWGTLVRDEPGFGEELLQATRPPAVAAGERVPIASGGAPGSPEFHGAAGRTNAPLMASVSSHGSSRGKLLVGAGLVILAVCGGFWLRARRAS